MQEVAKGTHIWITQQESRVEELSPHHLLRELQSIMNGENYSWYRINALLQKLYEEDKLEFAISHGTIVFEWNNLCHEKRVWEKAGQFSVDNPNFNKDCLINLYLIPVLAGLPVGTLLATQDLDHVDDMQQDLWVGPRDPLPWSALSSHTHNPTLPQISEDSEYSDKSGSEGLETQFLGADFISTDGSETGGSFEADEISEASESSDIGESIETDSFSGEDESVGGDGILEANEGFEIEEISEEDERLEAHEEDMLVASPDKVDAGSDICFPIA